MASASLVAASPVRAAVPPNSAPNAAPAALRLDYQTGNFSQWNAQQLHRAAQQAIVTTPARPLYTDSARFVVAPGDYTNGGTSAERSEVMASIAQTGNPAQGQTMWFAWSTFIPAGTQVDSNATSPVGNGWMIFTQWHGTADSGGGPNIALSLTKGTATPHLVLDTNGGDMNQRSEWVQSTAFPLGQWVDFTVGVTWGTNSTVGRMTVKINGTTWVNNAACANLYNGQSAYFKQGIYRSASKRTHTVYHTATRRGLTEASVEQVVSRVVVAVKPGGFTGITPVRILDTRTTLGAHHGKLGAGATLTLTVPHLPAGATSVALNVTVANPTAGSALTVYPGGQPLPLASNLNYLPGQIIPNMVMVPLGSGNTVTFHNAAGSVNVIADLIGYYASGTGGGFTGITPVRVLDTRHAVGAPKAKLGAGRALTLTVPNLPAGATAVALNVTVTNPTAGSAFLTVYPGGKPLPLASNLNYLAGQTIPNMVMVPLGPGKTVTFYNSAGTVNVIADVLGYYAPGTGSGFSGINPVRVLDTRTTLGAHHGKLGAGATLTLTVPNLPAGATAVALNVTVTNPTTASTLTVCPGGTSLPLASNLNYLAGQTIPNMVLVPLGPGNTVTFHNSSGTVNVIADVLGYFSQT